MTIQSDLEYELEKLIDTHGLPAIVGILVEICDQKASHVDENWQDKKLAKDWEKKASALLTAKNKIERFE